MTTRDARWVAATLLCLAPAVALPFGWYASGGLVYLREDSWAPAAPTLSQPRLDVALQLSLHGDVIAPEYLLYAGNVGYLWGTASANGTQTDTARSLTYELQANVLHHPSSPLKLSGFASKTDSRTHDFLSANTIGDQTATTYGATVTADGIDRPSASVGFARADSHQTLGTLVEHDRSANTVTATVSSRGGPLSLSGNYRGEWVDGNWVADQYQAHHASVIGYARFGAQRDLTVYDTYYRRIPTAEQAGSFASEINTFIATYRDGNQLGRSSSLSYSDLRTVTTLDATSEQRLSNSLAYSGDYRLPSPEFFVRGGADIGRTSLARTGVGTLDSSGGTLGAQLWWYRDVSTGKDLGAGVTESWQYELAGGPVVSYLDTVGRSAEMGYGASAHGRMGVAFGSRRINGVYDVVYGKDLHAEPGWTLSQSGNAAVSGVAGAGRYSLGLNLSATRRETPVFGSVGSRTLSAIGSYRWGRHAFVGQASITNGTVPGTSSFVGDGIFVPTGFGTRQSNLVAQASTALSSGLAAHVDGRYSESAGPGQPSTSGWDAGAGLSWRYAAFDVSIEDRISWYYASGGRSSQNQLLLQVTRSVGSGR